MNEFKKLRKAVRMQALRAGIVKLVAQRTGKSKSTVSRTFAGRYDNPNKEIIAALHRAMVDLGIDREFTA
jgi:transcriptional regulator with XRE-family HTH domain